MSVVGAYMILGPGSRLIHCDRATISNMTPLMPPWVCSDDEQTIEYLTLTGREPEQVAGRKLCENHRTLGR